MNLFALASLSLGVASSLLAAIIFIGAKKRLHVIWGFMNVAIAIFGFGTYMVGVANNYDKAFFSWQLTFCGIPYIAVFFYHIVHEFCNLKNKLFLWLAHLHGALFALTSISTTWVVNDLNFKFGQFYYYEAGIVFNSFFFFWILMVIKGFIHLYQHNIHSRGFKRTQGQYFFYGMLVGFASGSTTAIPSYGIDIYPGWHFFVCIYAAIQTYALFRYQVLDIKVAITRFGVFVVVYSLVLGIPFGLVIFGKAWLIGIFAENWFWIPMLILLVLATAGPFIYLFIQRKAEDALLQEEKRIQDLLSRVSVGMRTIRDLSKLSELIVDILMKHLRLDNAAIYLYNTETAKYVAKVSDPERVNNTKFGKDAPLVRHLEETKYPVVYEEVKLLSDSEQDGNKVLREIAGEMADLQAGVVVPAMSDNFLLGFIVLGERKDKRLYSVDLINVLSVLGNQAALAIENCHYIQRMQAEGLAERMISLDHMASSMAHEIDNPMHIIRTSLSFVKSALLRDPRVAMPDEIKQDFDESLARSLNASERVSSMIKAILDYSRMGTGKLESIRVSDALEGFLQLIQPQIREERVQFAKEIENDLPPVLGDRVQMEEVFMNFVRNSLHAVRRKEEKKITLKIFRKNETIIRIECSDNGYGIPGEIINDIFLSSMTTKGSTEGTGLGLFRVRKIVDIFRGKVWAESEGKGKGATFIVELPVYGGHKSNTNGD